MLEALMFSFTGKLLLVLLVFVVTALPFVFGGVLVTTILDGSTTKIVDVTATADADTQAVITHSFGVAPLQVLLEPRDAAARLSLWITLSAGTTNVAVGKSTVAGSGAAPVQLRVHMQMPHTLVR
jgi:hypothetical protein